MNTCTINGRQVAVTVYGGYQPSELFNSEGGDISEAGRSASLTIEQRKGLEAAEALAFSNPPKGVTFQDENLVTATIDEVAGTYELTYIVAPGGPKDRWSCTVMKDTNEPQWHLFYEKF